MTQDGQPQAEAVDLSSTLPVCPHCLADPVDFNIRDTAMPDGRLLLVIFCANPTCRTLLSVTFAGRLKKEDPLIMNPNHVPVFTKPD